MSNQIMLKKDKTVKVFNNQQQVADYLGVTKQAVAKAIKKQVLCKGSELTVLYKKAGHSDRSNSLIIDGKLIGNYESIERKYGNLFVIGFEAEENQRECGGYGMTKPGYYHQGNIDVIKFSEENFTKEELKGFYRMNVLKYVTRFDKKGSALSDLEKAAFYLEKLKAMESEPVEQTKPENELSTFLRSLSDMSKQDSWVGYLVPNSKVSTFYGGTNEND